MATANPPRVLIIYYSFSAQTAGLVHRLAAGLAEEGCEVVCERLQPVRQLKFPIGTIPATVWMMLTTFLRFRVPIQPLSPACAGECDLVVLAGPTWSYNPSGPVLSLLDRDGERLFAGRRTLALISCRGYWRMHWLTLRWQLRRLGAVLAGRAIFPHTTREPWRTIGVFLKLAGRVPERGRFLGSRYPRYGHTREQQEEACRLGRALGRRLRQGEGGDFSFVSGADPAGDVA
ncbi:MAG: hypothetical protein ACOY3Z_01655 [Thermodesulfobacteriota bacterium]